MATVDTLLVQIALNSSAFLAASKSVQNALGGIKMAAQAAGFAAAAMFVKSSIVQLTEQATAVGNLSRAVRENAEDLQAWGEAVKREGGTAEGFNSTVKKLSDDLMSIPLSGGNSPLLGGLARLGVQFRNLDGSIRKPLDVMKDLADKFKGLNSAQALAMGQKMGLDEATIRLLQKGKANVNELVESYKKLGVLSQKDVESGERMRKMFQDYNQVMTALSMRIARAFMPMAEKLLAWLNKGAQMVSEHSRAVEAGIAAIALVITAKLAPALLKLALNPVMLGIAAVAAALFLLIEDFMAWRDGADSVIGDVVKYFENLWNGVKRVINTLLDLWDAFSSIPAVAALLDSIVAPFKEIGEAIGWVVDQAKALFGWLEESGVWDKIKDIGGTVWGAAKKVANPLSGVMDMANALADYGSSANGVIGADASGGGSVDNSKNLNQNAHIDKVIINNPQGDFTKTINGEVAAAPVMQANQSDMWR